MKKNISFLLTIMLLFALLPSAVFAADTVTATKTTSKVLVDGAEKAFGAYNINGNNYFKLRDIALVLNGTPKQFEVTWDGAKNAINIASGSTYTAVGGEMVAGTGEPTRAAALSASKIYLNGKEVKLAAYNIGGNNYFKLRDLGASLDFGVEWDGNTQSVKIDSSKPYVEEATPVVLDNTSDYLTVGELSKLFTQAIFTNTKFDNDLAYANLMLDGLFFDNNNKSLYDDTEDMKRFATRSELARVTVVYYLFNHEQIYFFEDINNLYTDLSLKDLNSYKYCNYAVLYNIMQPTSTTTFGPQDKITKDDFYKALNSAAK